MKPRNRAMRTALLAGVSALVIGGASRAAEVTPDRLVNADKGPHNWLMNHRTYDAQRYSPLTLINKANVKGLKPGHAGALGRAAGHEVNRATPPAGGGVT